MINGPRVKILFVRYNLDTYRLFRMVSVQSNLKKRVDNKVVGLQNSLFASRLYIFHIKPRIHLTYQGLYVLPISNFWSTR